MGIPDKVRVRVPVFSFLGNLTDSVPVKNSEYVVLEGYKPPVKEEPEVKEVKRTAKIGEYIKIVDAEVSFGAYKNGDILKVVKLSSIGDPNCVRAKVDRFFCDTAPVFTSEYVVLEGYKPEKK